MKQRTTKFKGKQTRKEGFMKSKLALLCGILVISTLVGCEKEKEDSYKQSQVEKGDVNKEGIDKENVEPIKLVIAARGGSHVDVINTVKGAFEEEHNCTIEVLGLEADDLKQKIALDSKNTEGAYDIMMIDDPWMPEFSETELLLNLTAEGYEADDDFVTKSMDIGRDPYATGDVFALPFAGNVTLLFYNQEVLDSIEAEVPDNWADTLNIARKTKEAGKVGYIVRGQQGNPIVGDYMPILWAYGGDIFDKEGNVVVDSPQALAALELYIQLYKNGDNYEKNDLVAAVSEGNAAMSLGWPSWYITGENASAGYAPIPAKVEASSESNSAGVIGNWMMGVTKNTANKGLAIELLQYLTSAETQKIAAPQGAVPTRTSVFKDAELSARYPFYATLLAATEQSNIRPRTPLWSQIENVYGIELSNALVGAKEPVDALADAKAEIEKVIK